ncbi:MAG: alpha-mannosidase [Ruminococcaceae bacterium]|nr:alpha-mannosidase [Oscillospiraceae bacterium]
MKKLHLLCNAHLDPAWLWRWNAGAAEAISTFRVAADFCEKYDGFVFNHNEALLYEWIEEYEPKLFERIKKLIQKKKWVIVGGWYLQSDCIMPSGESLLSQIRIGQTYFKEKFGVETKTAFNVDSFGHSRGLVQILKKTGYEGYIIGRPAWLNPGIDFLWEGYDGSKILTHGAYRAYASPRGKALEKVQGALSVDTDTGLCLWGIGNHGGGPSKIDLENIDAFIKESDVQIIHSSGDAYIEETDKANLAVCNKPLIPFAVGCYTTMVRIKQANRRVENKIAETEKIISYVQMNQDFDFDVQELQKAKKALAFCQFHDILPGTAIKSAEEDALHTLSYAEEITDKLYNKAFMRLCDGEVKAEDGTIPIMVFNPHPFAIEGEFEVDFILQSQNRKDDEITVGTVYDANGNRLPTQNEKPESSFNMDWTKKVCFRGKLEPSKVTRFNCKLETIKADENEINRFSSTVIHCEQGAGDCIEIKNEKMTARISKKTGLIDLFEVSGKTYIKESGVLEVYRDDEDPWAMNVDGFTDLEGRFALMTDAEVNAFLGYPDETMPNVRIVEDGAVRTIVQAFFVFGKSVAMVQYTLPKNGKTIDINIKIFSTAPNKMIKYRLDTSVKGVPWGETAFGAEILDKEERESVFHKWCGIKGEGGNVYVLNEGTYGGSFTENCMKLSLLRTPVYSAHPIGTLDADGEVRWKREYAPRDRFIDRIDTGKREFSFRLTAEENPSCAAQVFNEKPRALSFFPSGDGEKQESGIFIDNQDILLSSVRKKGDKFELTVYNSRDTDTEAVISFVKQNQKIKLAFVKHELKILEV